MHITRKLVAALAVATALTLPAMAQSTITAPGQSTSGTYMDYMKTVYDRATFAELLQVPIATFDKEFELSESFSNDITTIQYKLQEYHKHARALGYQSLSVVVEPSGCYEKKPTSIALQKVYRSAG